MKLVKTAEMRKLDAQAIDVYGIPGEVLMERAGRGVADCVFRIMSLAGIRGCVVHIVAGRGNNGGDAFVVARVLHEESVPVDVWLAGDEREVRGDAAMHLGRARAAGIEVHAIPSLEEWETLPGDVQDAGGMVVDGVLGTGISGRARGPASGAIRFINHLARRNYVVSIDLPSGLDADTGRAEGDVVQADVTVTLGLPKVGLIAPSAAEIVGSVEVVDIGIPRALTDGLGGDCELLAEEDLAELLPRRLRQSHKGTYGHLLVLGGARGYTGAVALTAMGALRSGVGLVTVITPDSVASAVASVVPEAMVQGAAETDRGSLDESCLDRWAWHVNDFSAVVVGPGMTQHDQSRRIVEKVIGSSRVPVVMDADALNVSAGRINVIRGASCPLILTPHPGEMARVLACHTADVQADRQGVALKAARSTGATVVLKGCGTVIANRNHPLAIGLSGNPGMATAGSGDVLSGVIGAFLARGVDAFLAARGGVYLHGRAGDVAALRHGQAGMVAGDVVAELPYVMRDLSLR